MPTLNISLEIPETESPVPTLCSIHATDGRGDYGDATFRGNCSGELIADLLEYFGPESVLDPMQGSGTCRDIANELEIDYRGFDLKDGFDATDSDNFKVLGRFDFVWLHPPYWDMIRYNDNPRCLSQSKTLLDFLGGLSDVIGNCEGVLGRDGKLAILIGDYTRNGSYPGLPFHTFQLAVDDHGLRLACPEIIRLQHGARSTAKRYRSSFIPRLHDVCLVFKR